MKVLHYVGNLSRSAGGLYFSVSGLARAEHQLGAEIAVIGGYDEFFERDRYIWEPLPLTPHRHGLGPYGLDYKVISHIRAYKPDIFHVHGIWSAASVYARAAQAMGLQVVVSPHGMADAWIVNRRRRVKGLHASLFERPVFRRAHIHALNISEAQSVGAFSPASRGKTFILPNGIDPDGLPVFDRHREGAIYLGRLHPKKQVLELIQRWAQYFPDERLTVAGWGEEDYTAEIRKVASASQNIVFAGPLYGTAKSEALHSAKIFLLPSLSEGLPMAVLEALHCGAVPLITEQCNLPELFEAEAAISIEANFSDFEDKVSAVLSLSECEIEELAKRAVMRSKDYEWMEIAHKMLEAYQGILEK